MTEAQRMIFKYIDENFILGSVRIELRGSTEVKITDRNKDHMILAINLYCDIMDAETNKIIAVSDITHNLDDVIRNPFKLPTKWMNLPQ